MDSQRVLLEIDAGTQAAIIEALKGLGFTHDRGFTSMPMEGGTTVIRGWIEASQLDDIRRLPGVHSISEDAEISPFTEGQQ